MWLALCLCLLATQLILTNAKEYEEDEYDNDDEDDNVVAEVDVTCKDNEEKINGTCRLKAEVTNSTTVTPASDSENSNTTRRAAVDYSRSSSNSYEISYQTSSVGSGLSSGVGSGYATPGVVVSSSYPGYASTIGSGSSSLIGVVGTSSYPCSDGYCGSYSCPDGYRFENNQCVKDIVRCPAGSNLQNGQCSIIGQETYSCPSGFEFRGSMCHQIGCIDVSPVPPTTPRPICPLIPPTVIAPPRLVEPPSVIS